MSDSKGQTVVSKELEDYSKVSKRTCPKFFQKDLEAEGYRLVLIQVPKNFDVSTLDGEQIDLDELQEQVVKEDGDENLVLERLDENCEKYLNNQVVPLLPEDNKIRIKKKIHKVFKLYTKYNAKEKINRKHIIRTIPKTVTKDSEQEQE